jgi:hypothetical protein
MRAVVTGIASRWQYSRRDSPISRGVLFCMPPSNQLPERRSTWFRQTLTVFCLAIDIDYPKAGDYL